MNNKVLNKNQVAQTVNSIINATPQSDLAILESMSNAFDEFDCEIGDIIPEWSEFTRSDGKLGRKMESITYGGIKYNVSNRFVSSLCSRFGFGYSIFRLFDQIGRAHV